MGEAEVFNELTRTGRQEGRPAGCKETAMIDQLARARARESGIRLARTAAIGRQR